MSGVNLNLDKYQFYPGNDIRGKAVCNFRTRNDVRKVRIRLKGEESTHWTGMESYYDSVEKKHKQRTVSYHGNRDFLLRDHIVHGEGTMGLGEHVFPFEFTLPEDLPSSFQHHYGKIRFSVKVTVDRPLKMDFESEREIIIISPVNLQTLSASLLQPVEYSNEKTICCFCCASGPVQLDVNLEKRAFIVGENAGIRVYCLNLSNVNVENINAEIKRKLTFKTTHPSTDYKYDTELVAKSHNSGVGAHGDKTFNLMLEIPSSTVVPNFNGCELFSCDSELKVVGAVAGCHTDLGITTNVALGHVPILEAPPVIEQYGQSVPPYPVNEIQPMSMMSMPMPDGYEAEADRATGLPPYPVPAYSPGPSAPLEIGPSAPSNLTLCFTHPLDPGPSPPYETPPPTYDEAAKNYM